MRVTVPFLISFSIVLSGCATTGNVLEDSRERYITSVANDPCSKLRVPFVEVREAQRQQIAKWAAIGATAGAAGGAAIDHKNRLRGALIGLVTGAVAGATIGYYKDLEQRSAGTAALRNAVFTDAKKDVASSDRLVRAVSELNRCRIKQLKDIAAGIQTGKISKDEAKVRIQAVKDATNEDNMLIKSVSTGLIERSEIYVNALKQSGATDADAYIASAKSYKPIVNKPKYAVARGNIQPISVGQRNKKVETSVESSYKNAVELDAMQTAHAESVDEAIKDIDALLL